MEKVTVLYARVSTDEQGKNGHSLDYQKIKLHEYVKDNKIENYVYFEEFGESATSMNRPKIKLLIEMVKDDEVDEIVFLKIDRFSRNILDFAELSKLCEIANVKLTSLTESIDQTAMGEFSQNIMIAMAQLESKRISERTKDGYVGMLEKGIYPFGGKVPYGISKDSNKVLSYNKDIEMVKEILTMDALGYSYEDIRRTMGAKYNFKRGKNWFRNITLNTLYRGYIDYFGKRYHLLKPVDLDGVEMAPYNVKKRNVHAYDYKLKHKLVGYQVSSKTKMNHSLGKVKIYSYYKNPVTGVIIQEEKFLKQLSKQVKIADAKIKKVIKTRMHRLNELFVCTNMTEFEYNDIKSTIKREAKSFHLMDNIKQIIVDEDYSVVVKYSDSEIKFKYKK